MLLLQRAVCTLGDLSMGADCPIVSEGTASSMTRVLCANVQSSLDMHRCEPPAPSFVDGGERLAGCICIRVFAHHVMSPDLGTVHLQPMGIGTLRLSDAVPHADPAPTVLCTMCDVGKLWAARGGSMLAEPLSHGCFKRNAISRMCFVFGPSGSCGIRALASRGSESAFLRL